MYKLFIYGFIYIAVTGYRYITPCLGYENLVELIQLNFHKKILVNSILYTTLYSRQATKRLKSTFHSGSYGIIVDREGQLLLYL